MSMTFPLRKAAGKYSQRPFLVGPIPQHANDQREERALKDLVVCKNAIERGVPANEIVQGSVDRHIESVTGSCLQVRQPFRQQLLSCKFCNGRHVSTTCERNQKNAPNPAVLEPPTRLRFSSGWAWGAVNRTQGIYAEHKFWFQACGLRNDTWTGKLGNAAMLWSGDSEQPSPAGQRGRKMPTSG